MAINEQPLDLPPGFRFYPTDEEIITHYLYPKVLNHGAFTATAIGDVDLNKCEPWDLPNKAKMGEKDWYFFCQRDRKYPTGMRTNRATESGYWKATGKDKEIYKGRGVLIGMKKTLVFYKGRAPKGEKTNWVMHEFRLENHMSSSDRLPKSSKDEWAVCKVFFKNTGLKKSPQPADMESLFRMNSLANDLVMNTPTLPPLMDPLCFNSGVADVDDFEVKAILGTSAPPLNNYYFPTMNDSVDRRNRDRNNQLATPHNSPNSGNPPTPSTSYFHQSNTQSYGSHDHMMTSSAADGAAAAMNVRYRKGEQFSTQSMVSQDTETSPAISKMETGSCASYGRDGGGAIDLTNMWKYC